VSVAESTSPSGNWTTRATLSWPLAAGIGARAESSLG
jgi:hypothetical protein